MTEHFEVLTTTADSYMASHTCAALEEAGIPVMVEHVEITQDNVSLSGYRVLVPETFFQRAMRFVAPGESTVGANW